MKSILKKKNFKSGPFTRTDPIRYWIKAIEQHCHQIANDFIYLIEAFDIIYALDYLKEKLDAHINIVAADFSRRLSENDFGGASAASSERNRIVNMVSRLRAQSKQNWQERTQHLATKKKTRDIRNLSLADLDDRLPVRKRGAFDNDLPESIDHFKQVNDLHGHLAGDEVLMAVARFILNRLAHKGKIYRYGGEEFSILLPTYSAEEAVGLCERIKKDIEENVTGTKEIKVTASFGVACFPEDAKDAISLIKQADTALYKAKKHGRNRVETIGN